jgi:hypothetical protein
METGRTGPHRLIHRLDARNELRSRGHLRVLIQVVLKALHDASLAHGIQLYVIIVTLLGMEGLGKGLDKEVPVAELTTITIADKFDSG